MHHSGKPFDDQQFDPPPSEQSPSGEATPSEGAIPAPVPTQAATPESMPRSRVKKTILDLAPYRLGQRAYWIVVRSERDPDVQRPAEWLQGSHPWILWWYKMMPWTVRIKPPRAHPADTMASIMLCSEKPRIEPFRITDIVRSRNTGMFLQTGPNGIVMPEPLLFPTRKVARREIARMAKMFAAWTGAWGVGFPTRDRRGNERYRVVEGLSGNDPSSEGYRRCVERGKP